MRSPSNDGVRGGDEARPGDARRRLLLGGLCALFAAGVPAPDPAAADLLDQGRKLLQPGGAASGKGAGLDGVKIGAGLKEALSLGAERTAARLGRKDGFLGDPLVKIRPPGLFEKAGTALKFAGYGHLIDDLTVSMNRGAEKAAPLAKDIFLNAIGAMTIGDARAILSGPDDAATQYLRKTSADPLHKAMKPIVGRSLSEAGAVKSLDKLTARAKTVPGIGSLGFDMAGWVTDKAMDGLFLYIGKEEAAIRQNPAARTTNLLKQVFG
jgi:hypothetical protein